MKLKPLFDRVVVKALPDKPEKIGNIILPEITKAPEICEVVALGVGDVDGKAVNFSVKIGDKVIFNKYAGSEFKIDGVDYTIIKEKDILAILEK
ncbi:MAG: co-chaperone GroES [Clostridiales bacterium]|nr:co-chaperone GroES [Clostridiales bacterium]